MTSSPIAPTTESAPQQMPDDLQEALQAVPQPGQSPAVKKRVTRPRLRSPRGRAIRFLFIVGLIATGWWGSGYVFAYTDDAYLTSDLVSVTPEVTGPVEAVHVTDTSG
jgi:multidrug resistance efflux pump